MNFSLRTLITLFVALCGTQTRAYAQAANTCGSIGNIPEHTQVVWISPTNEGSDARRYLDVVELSELQAWIERTRADKVRLLERLGLVPEGGGWLPNRDWKVTIFDVNSSSLCRPIRGGTPGEIVNGVAICHEDLQRGGPRFSGCGQTLDTNSGSRGQDLYKIRWSEASQWGFCVMPLERLLQNQ